MVDFVPGESLFVFGLLPDCKTVPLEHKFVAQTPDGMIIISSPGGWHESVELEDVYRDRQDILDRLP